MINVLEKQIEGCDALGEARLDLPPLGASDDARQQIVREDPLGALFAAVDRERDALMQETEVGRLLAAAKFVGRERQQALGWFRDSAGGALPAHRTSHRKLRPGRNCEKEPDGLAGIVHRRSP